MKAYVTVLLTTTIISTVLLATLILYSKFIKKNDPNYGILEEYQFAKLEKEREIDTIFVGDSSLGNGIDAHEFDKIVGTKSINLALTGIYGYAGSYNMIKRALHTNPIRNVFIVQAIDIMARKVDYRAHILTSEAIYDKRMPFSINALTLKAFAIEALDIRAIPKLLTMFSTKKQPSHHITNDYHPQAIPLAQLHPESKFDNAKIVPKINSNQTQFLELIADICIEHNLTCVYAFGPIYKNIYANSLEMIENSKKTIASSGIRIADDTPYQLEFEDLGDSTDHVIPSKKINTTRYYANIFNKYITLH